MSKIPYIIILLLTLSASLFSQSRFEEQMEYAKQLYDKEEYFDAVTEFKRLLFFDQKKEYAFSANLLMGKAYKEGAKLSEAIQHFTIAEINSHNDQEQYEAAIEVVKANILRRTINQALNTINRLQNSGKYNDRINDLNYWRGWAYIFSDSLEKASGYFSNINPEHALAILCTNTHDEKYSESFAKIISVFIPGAGQIYTGNYLNGIISLAWNIFAGYLTIDAFAEDRIFDALVIGNLLWLRFYVGNIQNAEEFAKQNNIEITNKFLNYLQHEYRGEKPND